MQESQRQSSTLSPFGIWKFARRTSSYLVRLPKEHSPPGMPSWMLMLVTCHSLANTIDTHMYIYIYTYAHSYVYTYIYIYTCVYTNNYTLRIYPPYFYFTSWAAGQVVGIENVCLLDTVTKAALLQTVRAGS